MTKIVKTIDKVTNHENMRRYLHKKASKGGGTITADDITPELLENEDILKKVQNWGLSDEAIEDVPIIKFGLKGATREQEPVYNIGFTVSETQIDNVTCSFPYAKTYSQIRQFINLFKQYEFEYLILSAGSDLKEDIILKNVHISNAYTWNFCSSSGEITLGINTTSSTLLLRVGLPNAI